MPSAHAQRGRRRGCGRMVGGEQQRGRGAQGHLAVRAPVAGRKAEAAAHGIAALADEMIRSQAAKAAPGSGERL